MIIDMVITMFHVHYDQNSKINLEIVKLYDLTSKDETSFGLFYRFKIVFSINIGFFLLF